MLYTTFFIDISRKLKVMMSSDFFYYTKTLQATGTPISETHVEMTKLSEESNGIFDLRYESKMQSRNRFVPWHLSSLQQNPL